MNKDERNAIVERRYDELRAEGKHGHYECMFRVVHEIVDAELARVREELDELRALLDGAERDVARYRWLRDVWWLGDYFDTPDPVTQANSADEFDAAIDEARIPRGGEYGRFI